MVLSNCALALKHTVGLTGFARIERYITDWHWCEWWIGMLVASQFSTALCSSQKLRPTQLQRALLHLNTNEELVILTWLWLQQGGDNVKHSAQSETETCRGCLTLGCGGSTGEIVEGRVRWCAQVENVSLWCYLVFCGQFTDHAIILSLYFFFYSSLSLSQRAL